MALSIISMTILILIQTSIFDIINNDSINSHSSISENILVTISIILIVLIFLPITHKGLAPIAIAGIGVPLLLAGIAIPFMAHNNYAYFQNEKNGTMIINEKNNNIYFITEGYFLLGISMTVFSMVTAFKPRLLYVRNRPAEELDMVLWFDHYPIWDDFGSGGNFKSDKNENKMRVSVDRYHDVARIPLKTLMNEQERYLLWRYEYILVVVHGTTYMAKPNSYVPHTSIILRDKNKNNRMLGKAKYNGYFV